MYSILLKHKKLASILLLSYNSSKDLLECIPTIVNQTYSNHEIIVVDNKSSDNTPQIVKEHFPGIEVVETGANLGYPGGNNFGSRHARGEYIIVANPDTVTDPDWISQLIKPLEDNPEVAITTSKVLIYKQDRVNTCANNSHFTGLDFCRGLNEDPTSYPHQEEVGSISGCSFAIRREVFEEVNGFDPDFFMYMEDVDLSWRVRLAGYKIMYVPTSIIHHKYNLTISPWKMVYIERNRYCLLLKNYSLKMLLLISPSLIASEVVTWGFAILNGMPHIRGKLRAYGCVICNIGKILKKRQEVQRNIHISESEFIKLLERKVPFEQILGNSGLSKACDLIFNSFYHINFSVVEILA